MSTRAIAAALMVFAVGGTVACGNSAPTTATTSATVQVGDAPASPLATPTTTSPGPTVDASVVPPSSTTTLLENPPPRILTEIPLPEAAFVESLAIEGEMVVALMWIEGSGQQLLTWVEDEWVGPDLALYGFTDHVYLTDLAHFKGAFYAFLMGDTSADNSNPAFLMSEDGQTWVRQELFASLAYTPDSPPWPGDSAVTDAEVFGARLIVSGWITEPESGTVAAVWDTGDGHNWALHTLDVPEYDNEWGANVAINETGVVMSVGGQFYSGLGEWFSTDYETWHPIDSGELSLSRLTANDDAFFATTFDFVNGDEGLSWSDDGTSWSTLAAPIEGVRFVHLLDDGRIVISSDEETVVGSTTGNWESAFPFPLVKIGQGLGFGLSGSDLVIVELPE